MTGWIADWLAGWVAQDGNGLGLLSHLRACLPAHPLASCLLEWRQGCRGLLWLGLQGCTSTLIHRPTYLSVSVSLLCHSPSHRAPTHRQGDFASNMKLLQHYPPTDVSLILQRAEALKRMKSVIVLD